MNTDKVRLYEFILDHYSLGELKELCYYLNVVYADLEGATRRDKAQELVDFMIRRKRLDDLRAVLNQQRPDDYPAAFPAAPAIAAAPAPVAGRNPRQIFISHATADAAFAGRLAADLRRDGYAIWIAPDSIRSGEQWVRAINRGLEESGVMVLVLTPAAAASPWVEMETNVAIELERGGEMGFIPLLLEKGRYPSLWRAYQWVAGDGDYAAGLAALRARLAGGEKPSFSEKTRFPDQGRRVHDKTGIELIRVPAGPFLYGSADSDEMAEDDEKPQRTVELPEYWIGRYPVTNAQYKRFVDATNHQAPPHWTGKSPPPDKLDHPVVQVTWADAQAFCDWAGLALPTEEQWEKAARGTDGRIWPWGNEWAENRANTREAGIEGTTPVGRYSPQGDSPYDCVDMAGNVWEWTGSWYEEGLTRALRGGSWANEAQYCRCALRFRPDPYGGLDDLGLRALVAPS
jgi:formylglycine-generating enzyme required for sulfatase activity